MEIFNEIWKETPKEQRVSFVSGIDLNDYEGTGYFHCLFAHVLPKKQYPEYKLDKKAIVFLTIQEHNLYDMMTEKDRQEYVSRMKEKGIDVDWDKLWRFRTELLMKSRESDKTSHKA